MVTIMITMMMVVITIIIIIILIIMGRENNYETPHCAYFCQPTVSHSSLRSDFLLSILILRQPKPVAEIRSSTQLHTHTLCTLQTGLL
jgi:hypothetical protein